MTEPMPAFDATALDLLSRRQEVTIETSRGPDRPVHGAIIWVVVDGHDRVLVRSWLGERGRWYRELLAYPHGVLVVDDRRLRVRAERATDDDRIAACSRGLRAKYRRSKGSLEEMLAEDILDTTMELHPDD